MPRSAEFEAADRLKSQLESTWISLFTWMCARRGLDPVEVVGRLPVATESTVDPVANWQRRMAQQPGARFTPFHFLQFPSYVELARACAADLELLGAPPLGWQGTLSAQNTAKGLITYRNDLSHAHRFDLYRPAERQAAVAVIGEQLGLLRTWWPDLPVRDEQPQADESDERLAVRILTGERDSAAKLVDILGMAYIKNPINLIDDSPSTLVQQLRGDVDLLFRVGQKAVGNNQTAGLYVAYLHDWPERSAARERFRRRLARALSEAGQDARFLIALLPNDGNALTPEGRRRSPDIELVYPRTRAGKAPGTIRALIDRDAPTHYQIELLRQLNVRTCTSIKDIVRTWNDAFNVERVTNTFYTELRSLRDRLALALVEHNPDNPALAGWSLADLLADKPTPAQRGRQVAANAFATRQISRLLFLWFLQRKGWLGRAEVPGPPSFVLDLYRRKRAAPDSFFSAALTPLFFDALGTPANDRRHREAELDLGDGIAIPYLDGGLFRADADPFERALFGIDDDGARTRAVLLPDRLFDPRQDQTERPARGAPRDRTVLGLLQSYRFTTQESTPDDQSVDPDPELLGKVFENLYQQDDRRASGSYYTPREVVRHMCRQALDGYLRAEAEVDQPTVDGLRLEAVDWQAGGVRLTPAQVAGLTGALERVTVVDPAVGSGAFLVGMLQEIVLLRRGIASSQRDAEVDRASNEVFGWKQHAIRQSLHGVDINATAVEICRLRLWLSLVIEHDVQRLTDILPLPNLDFRVVAGDSLVDRMGADPFRESLPYRHVQTDFEMTKVHGELETLYLRYQNADRTNNTRQVARLVPEVRAKVLEIARLQLGGKLTSAERTLDLQRRAPKPVATKVRSAQAVVDQLTALQDGLQEGAAYLKPLLWPLVFPAVFDAERDGRAGGGTGGFDILLANPPYVRQESLGSADQDSVYRAAFPNVYAGTADLLVYFFERAVQLLRPGGWLAFVTSNKYMRAGYGVGIRGYLPKALQLAQVVDFGDLPVFDVAAYPAVVVGQKTAAPDPEAPVVVTDLTVPIRTKLRADERPANVAGVRAELDDLPALIEANAQPAYPQRLLKPGGWILDDPVLLRLFDRLMAQGTPLGRYVQGRIYYGIKTGLNDAFVVDQATRDALVAADPRSTDLIKPWLRGRDIKRWTPEWQGLYLVAVQNSGDRDAKNPWADAGNEPAARHIFADTYPAIHDHLSQFEDRLRPRADQGRYWWELRACAYYKQFEQPKVLWPDMAAIPRFAIDTSGSFMGNTAYFSPYLGAQEAIVLNSTTGAFIMAFLSNAIRGGYLRYFDQHIAVFPLPGDIADTLPLDLTPTEADEQAIELDEKVFDAYAMTSDERAALRRWATRRSPKMVEDDEPITSGAALDE